MPLWLFTDQYAIVIPNTVQNISESIALLSLKSQKHIILLSQLFLYSFRLINGNAMISRKLLYYAKTSCDILKG